MKRRNTLSSLGLLVLVLTFGSSFLVGSSHGFAPPRVAIRVQRRSTSAVVKRTDARRHRASTGNSEVKDGGSITSSLHRLRGGSAGAWTVLSSKPTVATAYVGLLACQGILLLLSPALVAERLFEMDIEKDSLESYLLRAIGAISIGMSVNIYLSIVQTMTVQRALGFGLLSRLLFVLQTTLVGNDLENLGGSKKFLSINEVVMAWTTFSLLTGAGNPIVSAKVFSCMALIKGIFLMTKPVSASTKFFGIDVSQQGMETSRWLSRGLGIELTTSAFFMGALAFGMDPVKTAGYTCLLWGLLDVVFRSSTTLDEDKQSKRLRTVTIARLCVNALFAAAFLL